MTNTLAGIVLTNATVINVVLTDTETPFKGKPVAELEDWTHFSPASSIILWTHKVLSDEGPCVEKVMRERLTPTDRLEEVDSLSRLSTGM